MRDGPSNAPSTILDCIGHTPMVPLRRLAEGLPVPVYGKCEYLNPGGSMKDRVALAIVDEAERRGLLLPGSTLIEATAGNTGMGLAMVSAVKGYHLVCVMPDRMSTDKRLALAALGAEVIVTADVPGDHPDHFQKLAERLALERGWFLTDQFRNEANVRVHEETTGPEIFEQTRGTLGAFVAGVGTGGTITGVGRYLKRRMPSVRVVLADPLGSGLAEWVRAGRYGADAPYRVEGIGSSVSPEILDRSIVDDAETVSDQESFAMTRRLLREEGLLVGGSAGTAVCAALRVAASGKVVGPVVALLADSWDRYLSRSWIQPSHPPASQRCR